MFTPDSELYFVVAEIDMKNLIALPVLALLTFACGGEGKVRNNDPSNTESRVSMEAIIKTHNSSLTEKQRAKIDSELSKVIKTMKANDKVPESCRNAIESPLKALYSSTMANDEKDMKLAKEEVNRVTSSVELCGEIAEYNQAVANVGVQPPAAGGALDGYPVGGGAFPPNAALPPGGGVEVGGELVVGGGIGGDLLGLGYWFGTNITNSILTIVEASRYCDTAGILFGSSALSGTFTGPTLANGVLDALGMYFFYRDGLRPRELPERCYPDGGYPPGAAGAPWEQTQLVIHPPITR